MVELTSIPLPTVAVLLSGGTPSKSEPRYWGGTIPWLTPKDMARYSGFTKNCVTPEAIGNGTRLAPAGAIFIAVRGMSLHNEIRIIHSSQAIAFNQDIKAIVPKAIDERFLYYALVARKGELLGIVEAAGHGTGRLPTDRLASLPIPDISRKDQAAIVSTLGALDDKIELNRRMNETLEAMARALFKSWFVDFDPVHAKAEGRQPAHMDAETAALFPDRFDDVGLPVGWGEKRVEDILELSYGKALPAKDRLPGGVPVYGSGGITGFHDEAMVAGPSVIVGRKGTVGSLYWEDRPFFPIDTVFFVNAKAPLTFCFYLLQTLGLQDMNTDAAVPGLNRNNVYRLPVPWGSDEIRAAFDSIVTPIRRKIGANNEESGTLAKLRDTLLPKLMSGEVRVREVEKEAEAVV